MMFSSHRGVFAVLAIVVILSELFLTVFEADALATLKNLPDAMAAGFHEFLNFSTGSDAQDQPGPGSAVQVAARTLPGMMFAELGMLLGMSLIFSRQVRSLFPQAFGAMRKADVDVRSGRKSEHPGCEGPRRHAAPKEKSMAMMTLEQEVSALVVRGDFKSSEQLLRRLQADSSSCPEAKAVLQQSAACAKLASGCAAARDPAGAERLLAMKDQSCGSVAKDLNHQAFFQVVKAYLQKGEVEAAERALSKMEDQHGLTPDKRLDGDAHALVVAGYQKNDDAEGALRVLRRAETKGVATAMCFTAALGAVAWSGDGEKAEELLRRVEASGLGSPKSGTFKQVLGAYARKGDGPAALRVFDWMAELNVEPDIVGLNIVISALARAGDPEGAERLFLRMRDLNMTPDVVSFTAMIDACAKSGEVAKAERWLTIMEEAGIQADVVSYTAVISAHSRQGGTEGALRWLARMDEKGIEANVVSYNAVIGACAKSGERQAVLELLQRMEDRGVKANEVSFNAGIGAYAKVGDAQGAAALMEQMRKQGVRPNLITYNALINAHAKKGELVEIFGLLKTMKESGIEADVFTYTSLFHCCANKEGSKKDAEQICRVMTTAGVRPNSAAQNALDRCLGGDRRRALWKDLGVSVGSSPASPTRTCPTSLSPLSSYEKPRSAARRNANSSTA